MKTCLNYDCCYYVFFWYWYFTQWSVDWKVSKPPISLIYYHIHITYAGFSLYLPFPSITQEVNKLKRKKETKRNEEKKPKSDRRTKYSLLLLLLSFCFQVFNSRKKRKRQKRKGESRVKWLRNVNGWWVVCAFCRICACELTGGKKKGKI